ncbi:MAG: hypothetical protein NC905_04985 [Candidatus Omnitrophica bacterium]|nr:hypothetical protein [Candidatus Omnitrophota bacterium]MCM8777597.1 hypothetical protein [Candidatus Omnitrophota bacterium]
MLKNAREFEKFEKELLRKEKTGFMKKLAILDGMYREASVLHIIPLKNPLDGLEIDIKIARVVNSV